MIVSRVASRAVRTRAVTTMASAAETRCTATYPRSVKIVEVGPRDGLQNEQTRVSTADKVQLIQLLSRTGLRAIEATSFVSPTWVPQVRTYTQKRRSWWALYVRCVGDGAVH